MALTRSQVLPARSIFHGMWRTVAKQRFFGTELWKAALLTSLFNFFHRAQGKVALYSYCLMDNHYHIAAALLATNESFSAWVRAAHSSIAQKINRVLSRVGPVGAGRPKTVLVEDQEALMRVMFYIDYNPVRAGLVDHPGQWRYSSYSFYAYGRTNKYSKHLTRPRWYLDLGLTDKIRQRAYRKLSAEYFNKKRYPSKEELEKIGVGSLAYTGRNRHFLRLLAHHLRKRTWHPRVLARMAGIVLGASHTDDELLPVDIAGSAVCRDGVGKGVPGRSKYSGSGHLDSKRELKQKGTLPEGRQADAASGRTGR